ncbi:MAG: excinuclease ABC subunit UvrC [Ruminococcaceae bacterium]|nr:excinuclease ABC subunit UvrC [Oscillospiraceae bacterium]
MLDFSYKIKSLPEKSGVYIMKDKDGTVIYVGKAKILKNRVKQYFTKQDHSPKVAAMVSNISDFEYIITDTELEALILECNLIKLHMPKYNILLKDDKTYPFIKITVNEMYPQISITRSVKKDGARYFGPYLSAIALRQLADTLRDIFKLRSCNQKFPQDFGKKRPCLYYHIGKCCGVCTGNVDENEYRKLIDDVCSFLNGNTEKLISNLEEKMYEASNNLDFEKAAFWRDKIESIKSVSEKQKITSTNDVNVDAIAMYSQNSTDCIQVFFIRNGKMIGRENYFFENSNADKSEVLSSFIKQYYLESSFIPNDLLIECEFEDERIIADLLSSKKGRKVEIKCPKRGENLKLINMIKLNAKKELQNRELKILKDIKFKNNALVGLKNVLKLDEVPHRIEAFDISGFMGEDLVASMVTFVDAKPYKKGYKSYKIKSVDKNDDYASMREVITRRFLRLKSDDSEFSKMPDLIFVDGGIGHVNCAIDALNELGIHNINVYGIEKDDKHNTRAIAGPFGIIEMDKTSECFMLLVNIQDEMHRRAITHYRNLTEKRQKKSELDGIKGVGEKKRNALLKHLKNVENSTIEELESVPGIDKKTAQNIYEYFRQKKINK